MLRIITGRLRGRKLDIPPQKTTRPTTDRVRESMFNLLDSYLARDDRGFEGLHVLDAFAGSGSLGLEAYSRGASHVTFFEQNPKAFSILTTNISGLSLSRDETTCFRVDATKPPKVTTPCDLVFLDPPYGKNLILYGTRGLCHKGWTHEKTLFVAEMAQDDDLPERFAPFIQRERTYGTTKIVIFTNPFTE